MADAGRTARRQWVGFAVLVMAIAAALVVVAAVAFDFLMTCGCTSL